MPQTPISTTGPLPDVRAESDAANTPELKTRPTRARSAKSKVAVKLRYENDEEGEETDEELQKEKAPATAGDPDSSGSLTEDDNGEYRMEDGECFASWFRIRLIIERCRLIVSMFHRRKDAQKEGEYKAKGRHETRQFVYQ